ncbi:hypothetical protein FM038_010155 [Shewanella eurypsychrophilus]|uniref:Uncharacterized protein n=1 Tax=Shewanella eurypsychrophilus TaxID=2593656 RepID=A0ABX6V5C5_9GAMM|nr:MULTISPECIES: hypothetical protein [Shewanella]QFU22484.1 hypothetical protein FS418_11735 [Shewanella sp. YLB-09]QPG57771.1 hypothetical protein FM038_010155 [Shewanella eurypsychrophilus]
MLNLAVVPLMPLVGALTANLSELIRGENKSFLPDLDIGVKTFTLAAAGFTVVWFALLVTAIFTGGDTDTLAGVEVLGLFLAGFALHSWLKGSRLLSPGVQLWTYRLAIPFILGACLLVTKLG